MFNLINHNSFAIYPDRLAGQRGQPGVDQPAVTVEGQFDDADEGDAFQSGPEISSASHHAPSHQPLHQVQLKRVRSALHPQEPSRKRYRPTFGRVLGSIRSTGDLVSKSGPGRKTSDVAQPTQLAGLEGDELVAYQDIVRGVGDRSYNGDEFSVQSSGTEGYADAQPYQDSISSITASGSFSSAKESTMSQTDNDAVEPNDYVNGNCQQEDTGRFPLRSPYDPSQRHPWYPSSTSETNIEVLKPAQGETKGVAEKILNGTDDLRKQYKANMYCKRLSQADIEKMEGDPEKLKNHTGTFAAEFIKKGTRLGLYEGTVITCQEEWNARLEHLTAGGADPNEVISQLHLYSWALKSSDPRIQATDFPIISAFSNQADGSPVRCKLSNINTAICFGKTGRPSYINKLLNVKTETIQTDVGKRYGFEKDAIMYVAKCDIQPHQQLLVSYGPEYLNAPIMNRMVTASDASRTSNENAASLHSELHSDDVAPSRESGLAPYDYDPARDGLYPLQLFCPEDGTVKTLNFETLKAMSPKHSKLSKIASYDVNPIVAYDDPTYDPSAQEWRFNGRGLSTKCAGTTIKQLNLASKAFLEMDVDQREKFFRTRFKVKDDKVYAAIDFEEGTFLGLFGGVLVKFPDAQLLADHLGTTVAALNDNALNLYDEENPNDNHLITAQGTGNLLQMVEFGEDWYVQAMKVSIFSNYIGWPVPDTMAFVASKFTPAGTCLTAADPDSS